MALPPDTAQEAERDEEHDLLSARQGWSARSADVEPFVPRRPVDVMYPDMPSPFPAGRRQQPDALHAWREAPRRRLRGVVPMLWTAAFAGAALLHAGEADRRVQLREPSAAELQMQERPARQIRGAWRSIGDATVPALEKPPSEVTFEDAGTMAGIRAVVHASLPQQTANEEAAATDTAATQRSGGVERAGNEHIAKAVKEDQEEAARHAEPASPIVARVEPSRTVEKAIAANVRRPSRKLRRLEATSRLSAKLRSRSRQQRAALASIAFWATPTIDDFDIELIKIRLARNMP